MEHMESPVMGIKAGIAGFFGLLTALWGWFGWLVVGWVASMAVDWISGSAAAAKKASGTASVHVMAFFTKAV